MPRSRGFIVSLVSMSLLALELVWTRLFSAEFFYSYAFLVISLAIMGLGFGALTLRLLPSFGRRPCLGVVLCLAAVSALAGPPLVFFLDLDFNKIMSSWGLVFSRPVGTPADAPTTTAESPEGLTMIGKLAGAVVLLGLPYFFGGLGLATIFRRNHRRLPRLYMADLVGAGAGVVLAVVLMNLCGTPPATCLVVLPLWGAATLAVRRWGRLAPAVLALASIAMIWFSASLLERPRAERAPVVFKHWDATSKLKVYEYGPEARGLNIDNAANSPVLKFDGNWDRAASERFHFGIDVSNLIERFDSCTFLSLGAGGGGDVLQALQAGATEIHAVEVNPYINRMMLTGELAEYTGRIYHDPRVHVVTEDARAYVRQHRNKFDVIYSLSSNSFAALASGSFAMAENYLFTTEAFQDYWQSLTPKGFMMMEHQFYVPRLTAALIEALRNLDVPNPQDHLAVYDLPQMRRQMILLSKRRLTDKIRNTAFGELSEANHERIHLLYPAPESLKDNLINRIVTEGWPAAAKSAKINVSPTTDNRPFVGQMGLWKNLRGRPAVGLGMDVSGYPVSRLIILAIMLVVVILAVPLNLLPYLGKGPRLKAAPWLYFFLIGAAFMAVEVVLIQKYTLFIGPSVYSISTILLTMLVASGIGSRLSPRVGTPEAFVGLLVWLLLEAFVLHHATAAAVNLTMPARMAITVLLVAPLGVVMGMPFPKGAARVGGLVDWGFAVNGAASVLGGAGILLVAMAFGFQVSLLIAAGLYALALTLMSRSTGWTEASRPGATPAVA